MNNPYAAPQSELGLQQHPPLVARGQRWARAVTVVALLAGFIAMLRVGGRGLQVLLLSGLFLYAFQRGRWWSRWVLLVFSGYMSLASFVALAGSKSVLAFMAYQSTDKRRVVRSASHDGT